MVQPTPVMRIIRPLRARLLDTDQSRCGMRLDLPRVGEHALAILSKIRYSTSPMQTLIDRHIVTAA
jgi:hypothetical protein